MNLNELDPVDINGPKNQRVVIFAPGAPNDGYIGTRVDSGDTCPYVEFDIPLEPGFDNASVREKYNRKTGNIISVPIDALRIAPDDAVGRLNPSAPFAAMLNEAVSRRKSNPAATSPGADIESRSVGDRLVVIDPDHYLYGHVGTRLDEGDLSPWIVFDFAPASGMKIDEKVLRHQQEDFNVSSSNLDCIPALYLRHARPDDVGVIDVDEFMEETGARPLDSSES